MAKLTERIIERLGGLTARAAQKRVSEAYASGFQDGNDEPNDSTTNKSYGYRRATGGSVRDLGGLDYAQVMETAWRIYLMSPIARRYLQIKRDYTIGRGVSPTSDDDKLQVLLDDFWTLNKVDQRLPNFVLQLHLLGEQLYLAFVRQTDGHVSLGYIDPSEIERVITDPENVLEKWAVVLKERRTSSDTPWAPDQDQRCVYRIVREDESGVLQTAERAQAETWEAPMLRAFGLSQYTGTCFYVTRNDLSNQARGHSDLLQVADWIDQAEQVLFALADRENVAGYFYGDVTLSGAADKMAVKARAAEIQQHPPRKGSFNVHNDQETWTLNAPDLKQNPSIETGNMLTTFVLGGLGLPRHWYGFGDETNRATAAAQGDPTWRTMEHDQDQIKTMLMTMLQFVRDQAELAGAGGWAEDATFEIEMPEMTARDQQATAQAANQLASALTAAEAQGWISKETAATTWAHMQAELGVEVDAAEELEKVAAEKEEADLQQQQGANDQWAQLLSMPDVMPQEQPVADGQAAIRQGA